MTGAGRRRRAKVEEHKAMTRRCFEAWNTGNADLLDELYAPEFLRHNVGAPFGDEDLEAMKQRVLSLQEEYPEFQVTLDESIISPELDRCATRWTFRGTHKSGAEVTMTGSGMSHHDGPNGKVLEEWIHENWLGLFQQFGMKLVPAEE